MRIKRLELLGFKSFMSKTVINIDKGLTGVVGPNGCGKSNIVDALLWVMGEQSPKSLRGGSMEDVIFNGSDKRKPSSLSEVTVTLENDGVFPAAYLNFSEISVTRRLYRNGESEYVINKVPVRLKDVKEVFMDSGARTYAVIEQGEIERIVLAKPEERREIIEEAAGITKYKSRKEESQRKLETTEQNLLRLNDIISELSKQLSDLDRQAKKAQGFKKLSTELKDLELKVGANDYNGLDAKANSLREEVAAFEAERESLNNTISQKELELETEKAKKLEVEEELNNLQNQTVDLNTAVNTANARLEMIDAEKNNIIRNAELRTHQIEALKIRIERGGGELSAIDSEVFSQEEILKAATADVEKAQVELDAKLKDYEAVESIVETKKAELLEHVQKELTANNNISNFSERLESNLIKLERLETERSKYESEFNSTKETATLLEANFNGHQQRRSEIEKDLSNIKQQVEELKSNIQIKEKSLEDAKLRFNSVESRLNVLHELSQKLEGVSGGVKYVMNSGHWRSKVKCILADVIDTKPEYEKAVEAVIADYLDAVVVNDDVDTVEIIQALKNEKQGQACFVSSALKSSDKTFKTSILGWFKGKAASLSDHVTSTPEYREVVKSLFSNVYIASDLKNAIELWNKAEGTDFVLVTLDGDLIDGRGIIRGGSPEAIGNGLLERKREIKELADEKTVLLKALEGINREYNDLVAKLSTTENKVAELTIALSDTAVAVASVSKELDGAKSDLTRQEQRLSEAKFDIDQLRFENSHLEKEIEASRITQQESSGKKHMLEAEINQFKGTLEQAYIELEIFRSNVTDLKVRASAIAERFKSVDERRKFLLEAFEGDKHRLGELCSENETAANKTLELEQEHERTRQQNHNDMQALDTVNRSMTDIKQRHGDVGNNIGELEKQIRDARHGLNSKSDAVNAVNATLAGFSLETGVMKQRFLDKYDVDITTAFADYLTEGFNYDEAKEGIAVLNRKLTDMGQVNLLAIEEFDRLTERHDFLCAQREDLTASMEDLRTAIKKIDETSRVRFKATFEVVNDKFKKFFPILFGGGTAELVMTNPDDLLNTGVEIFAQLPGKRTQNINLFSGGEKALTAISLVFSIFAIKPSPFCILDEVDAPLDDANITRFNEAVRALMDRSQFIVITHNKKTMENLDVLYGVTMEDPGISRLVSVRLGDFDANGKLKALPVDEEYAYNKESFLQ